jgi:hypothetical protein
MFSIYILPLSNAAVLLFTLGGFDQYFGIYMQKIGEKVTNCEKLPKKRYFEAKVAPKARFLKDVFNTYILPLSNVTVLLFTLGGYDQYFGI